MRSIAVLIALLAVDCTTTRVCKPNTIFLTVDYSGGAATADSVTVSVAVAGGAPRTGTVPHSANAATGTIEVDFTSYPTGQSVTISVAAFAGKVLVGSGTQTFTVAGSCATESLTVSPIGAVVDMGRDGSSSSGDGFMASDGFTAADMTPTIATARLLAPASFGRVTQNQPTLRWTLTPGPGTPIVDLCKDRACTTPLGVSAVVSGNNVSAAPPSALPAGVVYWRVRVVNGGMTTTSATWQFWVGKFRDTTGADTSNTITLDVNGDGYADFLVGASDDAGGGGGGAHLYLGNSAGSAFQRIDLTDPDDAMAQLGFSVGNAGDVNGDGFADFLIGAPYGATHSGVVHLYLGSAMPSAAQWNGATAAARVDLTDPDGANAYFGASVSGAGDVNGDGFADFLVGASAANSSTGAAHVYFGTATPSAAAWNGATPAARIDLAGSDGATAYFGNPVASAGDVNGDGFADFLIGAQGASSSAGVAHLYLGEATPTVGDWTGATPAKRVDLTAPGGSGSVFGAALAGVGDINNDGFGDIVVGAAAMAGGSAFFYYGESSPSGADWNGATPPLRIGLTKPDAPANSLGASIAGLGDVDGDGFNDFLVGANAVGSNVGVTHIYYGEANPSTSDWNGTTAPNRADISDPDDTTSNYAVVAAGAGDVNGDGYADFLVGAPDQASYAGIAHLYLGEASRTAANWNGAAPTKRVDFAGPDGANAEFGTALAQLMGLPSVNVAAGVVGGYLRECDIARARVVHRGRASGRARRRQIFPSTK